MTQWAFRPNLIEQGLRLLECLRAEVYPAAMKEVSPMPRDFLFCEQDNHLLGQRNVDHSIIYKFHVQTALCRKSTPRE